LKNREKYNFAIDFITGDAVCKPKKQPKLRSARSRADKKTKQSAASFPRE